MTRTKQERRARLVRRLEAAARRLAVRWPERTPSALRDYGTFSAAFDVAFLAARLAEHDGRPIRARAGPVAPRGLVVASW